jgi:hypothetical protein
VSAYQKQNAIVAVEQRGDARSALLARWARDAKAEPQASQLVLSFTREDVKALNTAVRTLRQQTGQLGRSQVVGTAQGEKEFSVNDRIRFGRNERSLGVKNGSLGVIERIEGGVLQVKLDGPADTRVAVDTKFYTHLDHGYAATVHKAQGTTVDLTYVLATPHFDRHTTYVAMSRHREAATVFYASDDFGGRRGRLAEPEVQARFIEQLSRVQAKDLAHDYLQRPEGPGYEGAAPAVPERGTKSEPTTALIQAAARQRWAEYRAAQELTPPPATPGRDEGLALERDPAQESALAWRAYREEQLAKEQAAHAAQPGSPAGHDLSLSIEARQLQAAQRWLAYREAQKNPQRAKTLDQEKERDRTRDLGHGIDDDFGS